MGKAVQVVNAGFRGNFLNNIGRYFEAGDAGRPFDLRLVIEVTKAERTYKTDVTVIVNSGANIGGDSNAGVNSVLYARFRAAIDGGLICFRTARGVISSLAGEVPYVCIVVLARIF